MEKFLLFSEMVQSSPIEPKRFGVFHMPGADPGLTGRFKTCGFICKIEPTLGNFQHVLPQNNTLHICSELYT